MGTRYINDLRLSTLTHQCVTINHVWIIQNCIPCSHKLFKGYTNNISVVGTMTVTHMDSQTACWYLSMTTLNTTQLLCTGNIPLCGGIYTQITRHTNTLLGLPYGIDDTTYRHSKSLDLARPCGLVQPLRVQQDGCCDRLLRDTPEPWRKCQN